MIDDEDRAMIEAVPGDARAAHGVPDDADVQARERAATVVATALADVLYPGGLRTSVLGAGWSRDVDAHVIRRPADRALADRGWLPLDPLLARVGSTARDRWAVVDAGVVLGALDLVTESPPEPVAAVLARACRRREVRLREVLELRVLQRQGHELPVGDRVVAAAGALERALGGTQLPTGEVRAVVDASGPVPLSGHRGRRWRELVGEARRPRFVVALSGVDGAGKSTLVAGLTQDLRRAGVPHGVVWARPGMRLRLLEAVARLAKRVLGQRPEPGIREVAAGRGDVLPSRRGVLGAIWATAVTLAFLQDVWKHHLRRHGVVIYDRHELDALATLEFSYEGVDLRVPRWLVRHGLPRADLSFHLAVPAEIAVARKPGDVIGERAVRRQLERYEQHLGTVQVTVLDATSPPDVIRRQVLERLLVPRDGV